MGAQASLGSVLWTGIWCGIWRILGMECGGYTIAIYEIVFLNKVLEELTFVSKRRRNSGGILYILVLFLVSYPTYAWIKQFYFNPCSDCVYSDKCYPYLSFLHFYRNRGGSLIDRSYLQKKTLLRLRIANSSLVTRYNHNQTCTLSVKLRS